MCFKFSWFTILNHVPQMCSSIESPNVLGIPSVILIRIFIACKHYEMRLSENSIQNISTSAFSLTPREAIKLSGTLPKQRVHFDEQPVKSNLSVLVSLIQDDYNRVSHTVLEPLLGQVID